MSSTRHTRILGSEHVMSKLILTQYGKRPERNWFVAHLARREYTAFARHLEGLIVQSGELLYAPGHAMSHVYFPAGAIISLVCCPSAERETEIALVADEGFVGQPVPKTGPIAVSKVVVQHDGAMLRVRRETMRRLLAHSASARELADRTRQALLDQVMLCAACNLGHSPRERCARWLLMLHDRVDGDEFPVKQEFLGYMLGMARQTVSGVASELQEHGSIEYRRGRVRIADRELLERQACQCYGTIRGRLQQLLS